MHHPLPFATWLSFGVFFSLLFLGTIGYFTLVENRQHRFSYYRVPICCAIAGAAAFSFAIMGEFAGGWL